ncbi:hypothetical protein T05_1928, partial [Trichinella murrelli]
LNKAAIEPMASLPSSSTATAGSHPKIRHLPQNCLAEMEITALYVYPRKCPLQCRDQGGLKIANYCLRL